jgi:hypothetical protein
LCAVSKALAAVCPGVRPTPTPKAWLVLLRTLARISHQREERCLGLVRNRGSEVAKRRVKNVGESQDRLTRVR